jgi:serine O-acetyltransferase
MSVIKTFNDIHSDYRRYRATGEKSWVEVVFFAQGFWASSTYRLSHLIHTDIKIPVIRPIFRFFAKLNQKIIEIVTGISLPSRCQIGRGLYIGHFGSIIVHPDTIIGDNCNLSQGVTIGVLSRGKYKGVPTLGDRVFVGPNAIILGGVTIGNDAVIGAGAIVTQPVPPLAVVAGNPAKAISYNGSFEYVQFDGMEDDPQRTLAYKQQRIFNEKTGNNEL